ncbi:MAG: hypothetical protein WC775_06045 [Patescibacteria group bacterium]|jgi:hypothetical protein
MKRLYRVFILDPRFLGTVIVLVVALIFFTVSLLVEQRQRFASAPRANLDNPSKIIPSINFNSVDEITFTPRRINNHLFVVNLREEYQDLFPGLPAKERHKLLIQHVITWAALRDFFSTNKIVVEGTESTTPVTASQIETELPVLIETYDQKVMKLSGFFLRVRFKGIYQENLDKLTDSPETLQARALELIKKYIADAENLNNPQNILSLFNIETTIKRMNNGELSESFTDYQLDPPLFDDPDFYEQIESAPLEKFTTPVTLKTTNPLKPGFEEYAYVSYYISEKSGTYSPIPKIVSAYVKVATIR